MSKKKTVNACCPICCEAPGGSREQPGGIHAAMVLGGRGHLRCLSCDTRYLVLTPVKMSPRLTAGLLTEIHPADPDQWPGPPKVIK